MFATNLVFNGFFIFTLNCTRSVYLQKCISFIKKCLSKAPFCNTKLMMINHGRIVTNITHHNLQLFLISLNLNKLAEICFRVIKVQLNRQLYTYIFCVLQSFHVIKPKWSTLYLPIYWKLILAPWARRI